MLNFFYCSHELNEQEIFKLQQSYIINSSRVVCVSIDYHDVCLCDDTNFRNEQTNRRNQNKNRPWWIKRNKYRKKLIILTK